MIEAAVIRTPAGTLAAATAADAEILRSLQAGKAYRVKVTQMSSRSLRHHRLFFGGLLPLAYEYWQPTGGLVGKAERETVQWVVRHMARQTGANEAVLQEAAEQSLQTLARLRAEKYGAAQHSMEEFRKDLTKEAGFFDVYETPSGVKKVAKSISFAQMDQEAFNEFYRACFQVAWNMMLSSKFENQEAALRAAEEMMEFGN